MEAMEALEHVPLRLVPGQYGLWSAEIPGSSRLMPDGSFRDWRIKEVCGAHVGDTLGVIVTIEGPDGEIGEAFAPQSDHMLVVATIEAIKDAAGVARDEGTEPPTYDFDGLCDLIAKVAV